MLEVRPKDSNKAVSIVECDMQVRHTAGPRAVRPVVWRVSQDAPPTHSHAHALHPPRILQLEFAAPVGYVDPSTKRAEQAADEAMPPEAAEEAAAEKAPEPEIVTVGERDGTCAERFPPLCASLHACVSTPPHLWRLTLIPNVAWCLAPSHIVPPGPHVFVRLPSSPSTVRAIAWMAKPSRARARALSAARRRHPPRCRRESSPLVCSGRAVAAGPLS